MNMPDVSELTKPGETLARWQMDDGPVHLHPGDLSWYSRLGAVETASAIRIWAEGGAPAAIGLLDGPQLLRLAIDPTRRDATTSALQGGSQTRSMTLKAVCSAPGRQRWRGEAPVL